MEPKDFEDKITELNSFSPDIKEIKPSSLTPEEEEMVNNFARRFSQALVDEGIIEIVCEGETIIKLD